MIANKPNFCVIGAGAMGCLYGGLLVRAGYSFVLLDRWPEHVDAINASGLMLEQDGAREIIQVRATTDPSTIEKVDVVIIFVDANSTRDAAEVAASLLGHKGVCITLQNGIGNREALASVLGDGPVMAGLSYASAEVLAPGHVAHTHAGPTWLGERDGGRSSRLSVLSTAIEGAGLEPVIVDDIEALIWDKWILNCAINAVCAITGLRQGEIPRDPSVEIFQDRVLDKLFAIAAA